MKNFNSNKFKIKMRKYLKKQFFTEELVIPPIYLNSTLYDNLKLLLNMKYPTIYKNKGYIFNITIDSILDNKITLSGQIIFKVMFNVDMYIPKIGHVFTGEIKSNSINKYQWIDIGPLLIYLKIKTTETFATVEITSVKSDYTLCFGKVIYDV